MATRKTLSLSIDNLDRFDLCDYYKTEARPALLDAAGGSTKKRFTMRDALSSLQDPQNVRQLLVPIARVAQKEIAVRERLTGFINDCATKALPSFEDFCPSDARPRRAIAATWEFLSGDMDETAWSQTCKDGLAAWAGWFAPKGFYANAEWAAVNFSSWHYPKVRGTSWAIWAEWAALNLLAYLGNGYRKRSTPDEIDGNNTADHKWAIEQLARWLETNPPDPLPLPGLPFAATMINSQAECKASFVEEYSMQWPFIAAFPNGLKEVRQINLGRNGGIKIPEGVTTIAEINVSDHPTLTLPRSLRKVGIINASYDGYVELPEGVETVDSISLYLDSVVHLPDSICHVGSINTEVESHVEAVGVEDEEEFWEGVEMQEQNGVKDHPFYDSFVSYKGRCFIKKRHNLCFD